MSASASGQWHWDAGNSEYYRWDPHQRCYIYQSGRRVSADGSQQDTAAQPGSSVPRTVNYAPTRGATWSSHAAAPSYAAAGGAADEDWTPPARRASAPQAQQPPVRARVTEGPAELVTDPSVLATGIQAEKRIGDPGADHEQLDPRYHVRRPGSEWYRVGKVFKVLWPEPAGNANGQTVITGKYGESIFVKIRWFIVIREGRDCCTCLPIQTYQSQGVGKPRVIKSDHSIVYTGRNQPQPTARERPGLHEYGMRQAIRVVPTNQDEGMMDPMSRINYAKPYTVEHNVKSFDFGQVHSSNEHTLVNNFSAVWYRRPPHTNQQTPQVYDLTFPVPSSQPQAQYGFQETPSAYSLSNSPQQEQVAQQYSQTPAYPSGYYSSSIQGYGGDPGSEQHRQDYDDNGYRRNW